jgi:hypothetical protein
MDWLVPSSARIRSRAGSRAVARNSSHVTADAPRMVLSTPS